MQYSFINAIEPPEKKTRKKSSLRTQRTTPGRNIDRIPSVIVSYMVITLGRLCAATRSSSQELIVPNVVLFIPAAWITEILLEPKDLNSRKVQRNSKPRSDTQPNHDMTLLETDKQ